MTSRSRRHTWLVGMLMAAWVLGPAVASGQGLADAARKEEARRKAVTKPAKVYTNRSLKAEPADPLAPAAASATTEASAASAAPEEGGAAAPAADPAPPDPRKTPEYWKKRMAEAIAERDNNALMIEALESRVNGLWADFTARDNPLERTAIAENRQKALDELARRKEKATALQKSLSDIEDEARRANVPPGWLR